VFGLVIQSQFAGIASVSTRRVTSATYAREQRFRGRELGTVNVGESSGCGLSDTLIPDEVLAVLQRRYVHVQNGLGFTEPVARDAAIKLYGRYRGNLGDFLRLLRAAVVPRAQATVVRSLAESEVVNTMATRYWSATLTTRMVEEDATS
jgi:hypothetical protein